MSLDDGLMVPVIRNADTLPLEALRPSCAALPSSVPRRHAQCRQLPARHLHGEHLGMTAIDRFSPSSIRRRWRFSGHPGDRACRWCAMGDRRRADDGLHLIFDHRAVDGYPAALFLGELARRIETADL